MRIRVNKNIIISLAVLSFLLSIFLPFYASYSPQSTTSEAEELSSIFGDKILICTANGFEWVSIKDIQNGEAPEPHPDLKCPVCFVAADSNNHASPANSAELEFSYSKIESFRLAYDSQTTTINLLKYNHQTRAPPFVFVS